MVENSRFRLKDYPESCDQLDQALAQFSEAESKELLILSIQHIAQTFLTEEISATQIIEQIGTYALNKGVEENIALLAYKTILKMQQEKWRKTQTISQS